MREVKVGKRPSVKNDIYTDEIHRETPIFGIKDGKGIVGMFIFENGIRPEETGWIFRYPHGGGCNGHHTSREKAMISALQYGIDPVTE